MKKLTLLLLALLINIGMAKAVPAHPRATKVLQPDGSYVTVKLHGDEWLNYNTTTDGYSIVKNADGYYVYAQLSNGKLLPTTTVAHDADQRSAEEQRYVAGIDKWQVPEMNDNLAKAKNNIQAVQAQSLAQMRAGKYDYNNFRGLLILVEFNDMQFSREDYKDIIEGMVNDEDYTGYTGTNGRKVNFTGSVRDYFRDNSDGKFLPEFDVYGPVQIDYSQYDPRGTENFWDIVNAAANAADPIVNFSDYDRDGDGTVDMIYFIFAGYGANYSGNDSRLYWPHRSSFYGYARKDGVKLGDYASSVELYGWKNNPSTVTIDGIGTICHEFSHVLGLPDFYDSDYQESGGQSNDPGAWSVMAGGSYNNSGRNPVGYSLFERYAVGFAEPTVINGEGSYTLENITTCNTGYRINSSVRNEFFFLENRQKDKWNSYLPGHGMLVFRVDSTNTSVWRNNDVNANPAHNYYEMVRADGPKASASASNPFPGQKNVTELNNATTPASLLTWAGKNTQWGLKNIVEKNGVITFDIEDTFILRGISLPETITVGMGMSTTLNLTCEPAYLTPKITWTSSDEDIVTVDEKGKIKGIATGTAIVTATAENGLTASCEVTVEEVAVCANIAEFTQQDENLTCLLKLTDAQVLYVFDNDIYVRDNTGAMILHETGINAPRHYLINGTVALQTGRLNDMPIATAVASTEVSDLTIKKTSNAEPHETTIEDLDDSDYADYFMVKGAQLIQDNGIWAIKGDHKAQLYNTFKIKGITVPANFKDKCFDIECIYGTRVSNGEIIKTLYLLSSPTVNEELSVTEVPDIATMKTCVSGRKVKLNLKNAQAILVDGVDVVMRDATGAAWFVFESNEIAENNIVNGYVTGIYDNEDGIASLCNGESLEDPVEGEYTVSEGEEAEPIVTTIEEVTSLKTNEEILASPLTSNLVKIEATTLTDIGFGLYFVSDSTSTEDIMAGNFLGVVMPKTLTGQYFDITGILLHTVDDESDLDTMFVIFTKSPELNETIGIETVSADTKDSPAYNIYGQRVNSQARGIIIQNGRKTVRR